jgi:preprotein translocase subunit SecD
MIKIILTTLTIIIGLTIPAHPKSNYTIPDGLYLIVKIDTAATQVDTLSSKEIAIYFSKLFEDFNSNEYLRIIIDTTAYVPLELEKAPTTEQQTEAKKKLLLSLTKEASEKLKSFTENHVMNHVAIVVDGEVLTMHKIKEPITSGQLQITRCNDNACQRLYVTLKDNIKKTKK